MYKQLLLVINICGIFGILNHVDYSSFFYTTVEAKVVDKSYASYSCKTYEEITYQDIIELKNNFSFKDIISNHGDQNEIPIGTIILFKSTEGNYGKMKIIRNEPDANLQFSYILYSSDESILTQSLLTDVRPTFTFDFETNGSPDDRSKRDFWWEWQQFHGPDLRSDSILLNPANSARFFIANNLIEQSCNDFNPFTIDDAISTNCECVGRTVCTSGEVSLDYGPLMDLYYSTNGDNWDNNEGWIEGAKGTSCNPCNYNSIPWYGVRCSNNRVICIDLDGDEGCWASGSRGNNLVGDIPISIGDLSELRNLNLGGNNLSGQIPNSIGNLQKLEELVFDYNFNLSGTIPNSIWSLSELNQLSFWACNLEGSISSSIGNLKKLNHLSAGYNNFSGTIPEEIGQLTELKSITVVGNNFIGSIPSSIQNLTKLETIWAGSNQFTSLPILTNLSIPPYQSSGNNYGLRMMDNKLTFSSLIPNKAFIDNGVLEYIPQQKIYIDTTIVARQNDFLNIDLLIDEDINSSIYTWYKDGQFYKTINGSNDLSFSGINNSDAGIYTVIVTNPNVPGLMLESNNITLVVDGIAEDCSNSNHPDYEALIALYNSTNGGSWTNNLGWIEGASGTSCNPCNYNGQPWFGIFCNDNRVARIELFDNNLTGNLPVQLGTLDQLTLLNLGINSIIGSIPKELGSLSNLEGLFIGVNNLSGTIPREIGQLTKLTNLWIGVNNLTGNLPKELGNLHNLITLHLDGNRLSGNLPIEIGKLDKLTTLFLHDNVFTGIIPNELGIMSSLERISLNDNDLSGCIPESFKSFCSDGLLTYDPPGIQINKGFNLSNNPKLPWEGDITAWCNNESQIGAICDDGSPITNEEVIQSDCSCEINVEVTCRTRDSLVLVELYNATQENGPWENTWNLSQPMENWFGVTLNSEGCISELELNDNNVYGTFPEKLGELSELKIFDFGSFSSVSNRLSGPINFLSRLVKLERISLFNNVTLEGQVLPNLNNLTNLNWLTLGHTNLEANDVCQKIGNLTKLRILHLGAIEINQPFPLCLTQFTRLTSLNIYSSGLIGNIPSEIRNLRSLTNLTMSNNQLSGTIPESIGELRELQSIWMMFNELEGNIPESLTQLPNLRELELHNNFLSGSIPSGFGNIPSLKEFRLHNNSLSGCFPEDLKNLCPLGFNESTFGDGYNLEGNIGLPWLGDLTRFCNGEPQIGAICDDRDFNTRGEVITTNCTCAIMDFTCPPVEAGVNQELSCTTPSVILGDQIITGFRYEWEGPGINSSNRNLRAPVINQAGTYRVTVTDDATSCSGVDEVIVSGSTSIPLASASSDFNTLTCSRTQVTLQARDAGPSTRYDWYRSDGSIAGSSRASIANQADTYTLIVTNTSNGCTASSMITIGEDKATPLVSADGNKTLTCSSPTVILNGTVSGPANEVYWINPDGTRIEAASITASLVGTYTLYAITNAGCQANTSVSVSGETAIPTADAGPAQTLTCITTTLTLGTPMTGGNSYNWTGPNGFSAAIAQPSVAQSGRYDLTVTDTNSGCSATTSVSISEDQELPVISVASNSTTLTCSNTLIELIGENNSQGNFSYQWLRSNGSIAGNNQRITVNQADTYSLVVTNTSSGCSFSATIVINEDKGTPSVNAGNDLNISCDNPIASLNGTVTGADEIYWTNEAGERIAENTQASVGAKGTYTLHAINSTNGCSAIDQIRVIGDADIPSANAGPDYTLSCTTTAVTIGSSAQAGLTYSWEGPNGYSSDQATPSVNQAGTYTLTVVNLTNNCSVSDVTVITDQTSPPNYTINDIVGNLQICGDSNEKAQLFLDIKENERIRWIDENNTVINAENGFSIGIYNAEVTNIQTGCSTTLTFTVAESIDTPIANAGQNQELGCNTSSLILDASLSSNGTNFSYEWIGPGINNFNRAIQNPTVNIPGEYQLVVSNNISGCSASASVNIIESREVPFVEAGADLWLGCQLTAVQLNGAQSDSGTNLMYQWEGPGINMSNRNNLSPTVTQSGIYTLTVENTITGCSSSDRVEVLSYQEDLTFNPSIVASDCTTDNGAIILDLKGGIAPYNLQWEDGSTSMSLINVGAGTYSLSVQDAVGCIRQETFIVENRDAPEINLGEHPTSYCQGEKIRLDAGGFGGIQFQWSTGVSTSFIEVEESGTYSVTATNSNGCEGTSQVNVEFSQTMELGYELSTESPLCLGDSVEVILQDFGQIDEKGNPNILKKYTVHPQQSDILMEVISDQCSEYTIDIPIEIHEQLLDFIDDTTIVKGELLELEVPNGIMYDWTSSEAILSCNNCPNPIINTIDSTLVNYFITDSNGCSIRGDFKINITDKITDLFPHINAITPNSDGKNDFLYFPGLESYPNNTLTVFDRWGEVVYNKFSYQSDENRWDGNFKKKPLPAGVYFYVLAINDTDINIKSAITLIREKE